MNYDEAVSQIEDGDIISIRKVHSLFGVLTKLFTGKYTHTGMAIWLNNSLWMTELNGGRNHAIPMIQLADSQFDVFFPPSSLNRAKIRRASLDSLKVMVKYGIPAVIATGINEFFGFNRFIHWRNILDCSGYVIKILEAAGWNEHSYITSPTKLSEMLTFKLSVN